MQCGHLYPFVTMKFQVAQKPLLLTKTQKKEINNAILNDQHVKMGELADIATRSCPHEYVFVCGKAFIAMGAPYSYGRSETHLNERFSRVTIILISEDTSWNCVEQTI